MDTFRLHVDWKHTSNKGDWLAKYVVDEELYIRRVASYER